MGESANFEIQVSPVPVSAISVNLSVSTVGNTLLWRGPTRINVLARHTLSLSTTIDWENMGDPHSISVKIENGEGYNVNSNGKNVATVHVNSIVNFHATENLPTIAIADSVANAILNIILNENLAESSPSTFVNANIEPIISISAISERIHKGQYAEFKITSSIPSFAKIQIKLTEINNSLVGSTPKYVKFNGGNEVRLKLATANDHIAEGNGSVEIILVDDLGYSISPSQSSAKVLIDDLADRSEHQQQLNTELNHVFGEYINSIGANSLDVAVEQVNTALSNKTLPILQLGGLQSTQELIQSTGESINSNSVSVRTFFDESIFAMQLLPKTSALPPMRIWGRGDFWELNSSNTSLINQSWTSDLFTGYLGFDSLLNHNIVLGSSILMSEVEAEFNNSFQDQIQFSSKFSGGHPYLGWTSPNGKLSLQTSAGYGQGEIKIAQSQYSTEYLPSNYQTVGLAGNLELFSFASDENKFTNQFNIKGNLWRAHQTVSALSVDEQILNAHQTRLVLEGTGHYDTINGISIEPKVLVGILENGKNDESTLAIEWGGGLNIATPHGISMSSNGQVITTSLDQIHELDLNSSINFDHGHDNLGLLISVAPSYRISSGRENRLFETSEMLPQFSTPSDGITMTSEIGIGFEIFDGNGSITQFGGFNFTNEQNQELFTGIRTNIGKNLNFELKGNRTTDISGQLIDSINLGGRIKW